MTPMNEAKMELKALESLFYKSELRNPFILRGVLRDSNRSTFAWNFFPLFPTKNI